MASKAVGGFHPGQLRKVVGGGWVEIWVGSWWQALGVMGTHDENRVGWGP